MRSSLAARSRIVAAAAALTLLLAAPMGCRRALDGGQTVLRVANWGGAGDDGEYYKIIRDIYAEFERRNPGVDIQIEGIPGSQDYVRKMLLSFVAGSAPDVMTLDASSAAVFIENGVLKDLTGYIADDSAFSLDDYYPNVVDIGRRGDSVYAIPLDFTPMVMYYNKDLFDKADVAYPEDDWTWDDFLAKAKQLTTGDQYGFTFTNWMPGWIMWLWNNGGDVLSEDGTKAKGYLDSPQNVEAVGWLRDLIDKHKVAPALSAIAAQGVEPFANGDAAMEISGHWALVGYGASDKIDIERIGVVPLPRKVRPDRSVTVMYESGLAIGENCKNPDLAWKFIKYMTSEEVQRKVQQTGIAMCARKDISQELATNPREEKFVEIVPTARMPWGSRVEGYDYVEAEGVKMMDSVLKSGADPKTALAKMAERIDRFFAEK